MAGMQPSRPPLEARSVAGAVGLAYAIAYVLLDALSFVQPVLKLGITPWSPQAGLTIAFLLWRGWRQAPWTFAAAYAAEIFVRDSSGPFPPLVASAVIAAGYGGLAWALGRRDLRWPIETRRDAAHLVLGTALAALVVAVGYVTPFVQAGSLPLHESGPAVLRYWFGDVNGVTTLAPLLLAASQLPRIRVAVRARWRLCLVQAMVLGLTLWTVFGGRAGEDLQFFYLLFVPVVWIALTWGVIGATAATLALQVGLMAGAQRGLAVTSLTEIQLLLVTLGTTALLLGAVVAERARALQRVAARETEQRALLAAAPDAVLATDPDGRIVSANPAGLRLFGAAEADLLQTPLRDWLADLDFAAAGGRAQLRARRAEGAPIPVEIAWVRLDPPGGPGYLFVVRDVSEREQAQAQLRERDTALARAMRFALAGELATALTHELNQPITALVSYLRAVEILATPLEGRDPRLQETLDKASREAMRAADVLKRLRDFYRTGTSTLVGVDLPPLIDEVLATFAERAVAQGVDLRHEPADVREATTDPIQLQMVLHNLLANALDAIGDGVPRRTIVVRAVRAAGRVRILVEDSGQGVAADVARELFEPFVTDKPGGMGLGLAISRSLMRSQGGDLGLVRTGPSGSVFAVELPASNSAQAAA
jgi:two-component system sensor kinase FixL